MKRTNRHIFVLGIALAAASLASFGVYTAVTRIPVREVEVASTFVVVAARSLPPGVRLTEKDVKVAAWPASHAVRGSFSTPAEVLNRALMASVVENEPLL